MMPISEKKKKKTFFFANVTILPAVSRTTSGFVSSLKQGSQSVLVTISLGGNTLKNIMWEEIQI